MLVQLREALTSRVRGGGGWDRRGGARVKRVMGGLSLAAMLAMGVGVAGGCTSQKRAEEKEEVLLNKAVLQREEQKATFETAVARLVTRIAAKDQGGDQATMHFLAMSGGGDYGAFGAGFMVGWGQAADAAYRRPEFDAVTGVSTGALLAPFAFLGTDESCLLVESFYRNPREDWIKSRGILPFWPSNPSFMQIRGLVRDLGSAVSDDMIRQMAAESEKGRLLFVSATNLDLVTQELFDLGEVARQSVANGKYESVRYRLLASSAIPAVFPPVDIDGASFADGGVTGNVLLRLDPEAPNGFIQGWKRMYPDRPMPKVKYWIIINNQLQQPPKTVQPRWPDIMSPSLAVAMRSATLAEVRWLAAQAKYANSAFGTDIEVRVAAIPDDWRPPVKGDFKKETMESLAELGRKLGADQGSWKIWTGPMENAEKKPGD